MQSLGDKVRTVKVAYVDQKQLQADDDYEEEDDALRPQPSRKKRVVVDVNERGTQTFSYNVQLPIGDLSSANENVGLQLKQITNTNTNTNTNSNTNGPFVLTENALDIGTLRYISNEETVMVNQRQNTQSSYEEEGVDGSIQIINEEPGSGAGSGAGIGNAYGNVGTSGVVVSSVVRGGVAWDLGIRAGDVLVATSATIGDVSFFLLID